MEFNPRIRTPGFWVAEPQIQAISRGADIAAQLFAITVTMFAHGIPEYPLARRARGASLATASYFGPRERLCAM